MLDRLPPWSHYKSEVVMDPEWARYVVDLEEQGLETPPTGETDDEMMAPLHYDPVVARLDLLGDRLLSLESALIWTVNPKEQRPRVEPLPRPVTALDRERESRTRSLLLELDAMFTGEGLPMSFEE